MKLIFYLILSIVGTIVTFYVLAHLSVKVEERERKGTSKIERNLSMYLLVAVALITIIGGFVCNE